MSKERNNMELWDAVCKTDPKYTKPVKLGRRFTAVDPMYQVRKATENLGMAGEGWGFELMDTVFLPTDYVALTVRVWARKRENYIDHIGMCGLYLDKDKEKTDGDCIKKAMTDGLTKGLSYFGFSADVFLGLFDDSRYVESVAKEIAEQERFKTTKERTALYNEIDKELDDCRSAESVSEVGLHRKGDLLRIKQSDGSLYEQLVGKAGELKASFAQIEADTKEMPDA